MKDDYVRSLGQKLEENFILEGLEMIKCKLMFIFGFWKESWNHIRSEYDHSL